MSKIDRETMSLLVECEDCHEKFSVTSGEAINAVTHKREFVVEGQSIFLTYYDCPKCGRRHYVQIDDKRSLDILKDVSRQFVRLSVKRKQDKNIPQKQLDKFKKNRQHLADYRMGLMKTFTGKSLHDDETDADFILRFSV